MAPLSDAMLPLPAPSWMTRSPCLQVVTLKDNSKVEIRSLDR